MSNAAPVNEELVDQIIRESSAFLAPTESGYWAPTERQTRDAIARALDIISNHIYYEGRKALGAEDDSLYQMRAANADSFLDSLSEALAPEGAVLPNIEESR